jgi:hypothetical protein
MIPPPRTPCAYTSEVSPYVRRRCDRYERAHGDAECPIKVARAAAVAGVVGVARIDARAVDAADDDDRDRIR